MPAPRRTTGRAVTEAFFDRDVDARGRGAGRGRRRHTSTGGACHLLHPHNPHGSGQECVAEEGEWGRGEQGRAGGEGENA